MYDLHVHIMQDIYIYIRIVIMYPVYGDMDSDLVCVVDG